LPEPYNEILFADEGCFDELVENDWRAEAYHARREAHRQRPSRPLPLLIFQSFPEIKVDRGNSFILA